MPFGVQGFNLRGRSFSGRVTEIKPVMGTKTVFNRSASERKDFTVMEVLIDLDETPPAPVGLQVDVRITLSSKSTSPETRSSVWNP